MKQKQHIDQIISKVLFNEASCDEVLQFHEWLNEDEKHKEEFVILKEYTALPITVPDEIHAKIAFEKIEKQMHEPIRQKRTISFRQWSLVASFTLLLLSIITLNFLKNNDAIEHYIYTSADNILQLTLPDGTDVHLNKNSQLTYTNQFGEKQRSVELKGEAFFDVTKAGSNFQVKLYDGEINVLGTRFNIKANPTDELIVATLEEGKILFKGENFEQSMLPGEQLVYNTRKSEYELSRTDIRNSTNWKEQLYRYRSITMVELCKELEAIYDVEITLTPRLQSTKVSGSFDSKQDIEYVLGIINNSVNFKWQQKGKNITIN